MNIKGKEQHHHYNRVQQHANTTSSYCWSCVKFSGIDLFGRFICYAITQKMLRMFIKYITIQETQLL